MNETNIHRLGTAGFLTAASIAIGSVVFLASGPAAGGTVKGDPFFTAWKTIGTEQGLPSKKVFAVAVDGPRIWAGTDKGLAVFENGSVRVPPVNEKLPVRVVTSLAVDHSSGDVWIGTMGGLARLSGGRLDVFDQLNSGLANNVVYSVAVDGSSVWAATAAGLSHFDTTRETWQIYDVTNTLMHEPWTYSVTVANGDVYVAVWGGGVIIRDGKTGRFRDHRDPDGEMEIDLFRDDGLVHDVTSSIALANDIMWVGTYFGLSRYDGRRWMSFNQEDSGLAGDFINFLRARDEAVWIATDQGLSRFDSETWHTWRRPESGSGWQLRITGPDGKPKSRSLRQGPASDTIYGIDLDPSGIWLATAGGLSHGLAARQPDPPRSASGQERGQ
jgi:ligand-binding sensor domain-containing protein